ncbi:transglutaminase-like domain-containing protein [Pseudactinotalea sp.]|uniref:transglutaminase-like domain-containing protein n=1 Tax=Pseudactinotalea sp. TaxID=1926260 RepID=UPI003B3BE857
MKRPAPVLWAVIVLLTALPPLASGYAAGWALAVLAACAVLPFGLAALGRLARVPRWAVATAGLIVGVVVALVFADRVDPASGALPQWRSSPAFSVLGPLIDSVPRLLTAPRPAPPDPSLLVPAALLVWIVALGVALAVVGAKRAGVAPLIGATTLHVAGALLTAGRGDLVGTSALATALALLLGWVLLPATEPAATGTSTRARSLEHRRRRGVVLPAIVAAVVATFALTAVAVPTAQSFEPRTLVPPPQLPTDATNPVPQAAVWAQSPGTEMFTITAVDGQLPERLAAVVLPDYTGVAWMLDARLRAVGVVATPDTTPPRTTRTATYAIAPGEYREAWLPAAGTATEVTGIPTLLDLDSGTLVMPGGWISTDPGTDPAATITSTINDATPESIGSASVPQAADMERYLELPRVPPAFAQAARRITDGVSSRWDQISLLAEAVRVDSIRAGATGEERVLDHGARSGSSYARLAQFLFETAENGGQVGTSEQFAGSFALLARTLGIPTRLVVGFEVPDEAGTGTATVLGEDARVWAEVYLSRVGWVAVDPSPDSAISTDLPTPEAEGEAGDDPEPDPGDDPAEDRDLVDEETTESSGTRIPAALALIPLAIALLGVVGLAIARAARSSRWRRSGDLGAWAHVEDAMRLAGAPPPRGATAVDLAASLPEEVTGTAVALAERAEARAYAPEMPDAGDPAWELSREVSTGVRRAAPWPRRLLWWVSPRVWRR